MGAPGTVDRNCSGAAGPRGAWPGGSREAALADVVDRVSRGLSPRASAVLVREPLVDPACPDTGDLDLVAVGEVPGDVLPERLAPPCAGAPRVDVVWLPLATFARPERLARTGLIAHRVLGSRLVRDDTGWLAGALGEARIAMRSRPARERRARAFLDLAGSCVREIGVTWDCAPLGLFWLHAAHVACVTALLDGAGEWCPNAHTRPVPYLRQAEQRYGLALERDFVAALRLADDPAALAAPLRRLFDAAARFREPVWPEIMPHATRFEYRYTLDPSELEWRLGVADELARRGEGAAATYFLRFWAYSLARVPMVHAAAHAGRDVSFLRPERAVRPALEETCPEMIDDLERVLGGAGRVAVADVAAALDNLHGLRRATLRALRAVEVDPGELGSWEPFRAPV